MQRDDLGEGPFGLAGASATLTTDPAPAASDVPDPAAEATMLEVEPTNQAAYTDQHAPADAANGAWPDSDRPSSAVHADDKERPAARPPIHAAGESPAPKRENPLVAGLVKAMREAAVASREETMSRLHAEAESRVKSIRTRATDEAAELKHRAESDISEIREWSKAEIARIREETERRIEARKSDLAGETERHAASVERLVEEVQAVVDRFQADMDGFFEQLLAENDPARLAALAEQAPEPPDLSGDGPTALDLLDEPGASHAAERVEHAEASAGPAADAEAVAEPVDSEAAEPVDAVEALNAAVEAAMEAMDARAAEALQADDAAAAEMLSSEGLDMSGATEWPVATAAAAAAHRPTGRDADIPGNGATRLLVTGLTSVAGISAFKGALGTLHGVHNVSVSSGDPGVFIFAISHDPTVDLATGIASLAGFAARITDATDAGISVVAHEPTAGRNP
ncbi:MAG TPA: hypothetical protein VNL94_04305 [Candidatus Binatia bacterium]|nr:hypothetical protein [Candidatus Binatia bacterium]